MNLVIQSLCLDVNINLNKWTIRPVYINNHDISVNSLSTIYVNSSNIGKI